MLFVVFEKKQQQHKQLRLKCPVLGMQCEFYLASLQGRKTVHTGGES